MKKSILLVFLTVSCWGTFAQHSHGSHGNETKKNTDQMGPMFKSQEMGEAYLKYTALKDALFASDVLKSNDAAAQLVLALQEVKNGDKAFSGAKMVSEAKSIEDKRKMFAMLSAEMIELVKNSKLTMGAIYVDYCPMANDNAGASWLSNDAKIANPYFGDKMPSCGSVKETIE
ncbi:DUF3347 domain-containing protein [Ekhidna sp.]|uniref:DUF3347 domain-containing protein n=1 Tax=Ekhidna sp. TaxID=2608089 RepID=UPI0032EE8E59